MTKSVTKGTLNCVCYLIGLTAVAELSSFKCSFENKDFCGWNETNFLITKYEIPVSQSGPKRAALGEYYIYFNSTGQLKSASLTMADVDTKKKNCLEFYYHMWGKHIGELSINVFDTDTTQASTVKKVTGNQNNTWHCLTLHLPGYSSAGIEFHVMKDGYYSIIALDEIRVFTSVSCQNKDTCESNTDSPIPTSASSTSSSTSPTGPIPLSTTTQQSFVSKNLPLIVGAPVGLLVVVIMVVGIAICCKRTKEPKGLPPDFSLNSRVNATQLSYSMDDRYPPMPEGEVYAVIDDRNLPEYYLTPIDVDESGYLSPSFKETPYNQDDHMKASQSIAQKGNDQLSLNKGRYQVTKEYPTESLSGAYVSSKDINVSSKTGKKISVSDNDEVCYTDIAENLNRKTPSSDELDKEYVTFN